MEANEAQELHEHAEHASHDDKMRPVAFTMSVLAVLVAVVTVMGHRTHTEAVLQQNKATDTWNEYQAKKIRSYNTTLTADLMKVLPLTDKAAAAKIQAGYKDHQDEWKAELKEVQEKARTLEERVELAEHKANRFDLGEALLEIGLVITSVTLLTRSRFYWYFGMAAAAGGIVSAALGLLLK